MADHSHHSHMKWGYHSHDMRKIPLLITGPALKSGFRGEKISKIFYFDIFNPNHELIEESWFAQI